MTSIKLNIILALACSYCKTSTWVPHLYFLQLFIMLYYAFYVIMLWQRVDLECTDERIGGKEEKR